MHKVITIKLLKCLALLAVLLYGDAGSAACYKVAAEQYGVSEALLRAIARVESGGLDASKAENVNRDGSKDIGRMQINTRWLPTLAQFGITEQALRDECTSIKVGAWMLANNFRRHGQSWTAVGAYNVGCGALDAAECERRRGVYAWRVYRTLRVEPASARSAVGVQRAAIGSVEFSDDGVQP